MIVSVIRIRPVRMSMSGGLVFVPVAVIFAVRHPWEDVIVMAIVMPMPVLMGGSFMLMDM